jgi:hypothetical protein
MAAAVTLAWTYSPEGAIVIGEEGPVTHLGCEGNTTYDFSTGLIFKNGRYFDPNTGIWITLSGMVVWNSWQTSVNNRNKKRPRRKRMLLLLLLFLVIITLAGCGGNTPANTPIPDPTATCTPTSTPMPTLPPPFVKVSTLAPTATSTASPTATPSPTWTPVPTSSDPLAGFALANPLGGDFYEVCRFAATNCGIPFGNHDGVDLVSKRYTDASCSGVCSGDPPPAAAGSEYRTVYSPVTGKIESRDSTYDSVTITDVKHNVTQVVIDGLKIKLTHISLGSVPPVGDTINVGDRLSFFIGADVSDRSEPGTPPPPDYRPHLHLGVTYQGAPKSPLSFLADDNLGYYYDNHYTLPKSSGRN